jgi:hypothetical protein
MIVLFFVVFTFANPFQPQLMRVPAFEGEHAQEQCEKLRAALAEKAQADDNVRNYWAICVKTEKAEQGA